MRKYIKSRGKPIAVYMIFSLIFLVTFVLYHLPVMAVVYPVLLCSFLGLCVLIPDYIRFQKRHRVMQYLCEHLSVVEQELPVSAKQELLDDAVLIRRLLEENGRMEEELELRVRETMDYYTTWVHQIKTPIAAMRLNLQNTDTDQSRVLLEELGRIEQYVEMVMIYLRLGEDASDYVFAEYALDDLLKRCIKRYASQFIRRKLTLSYEQTDVSVVTDEKWLCFVVEQVLSNALKYTKQGGISIAVKYPDTLVISDTGIGINKEDLPRIFEKGFTGMNGRINHRASGLGLYLCRQICEQLGHGIRAESEPGVGTSIYIDLSRTDIEMK